MDSAFLDVDRHGVLRIPGLLWCAFALLARHWLLILALVVSARREGSVVLLLGESGVPWLLLAMEAPIVVLAFAGFYRSPTASAWARQAWRHGREIVALTALFNIAWTTKLLSQSDYWTPWPELLLASCCLLDSAIATSMYKTPYFKQLFREFPERPPKGQTT